MYLQNVFFLMRIGHIRMQVKGWINYVDRSKGDRSDGCKYKSPKEARESWDTSHSWT